MSGLLDLHDIQGNILKAYGRSGYPKGRYVFFHVHNAEEGRRFVQRLLPSVTTSAPWAPGAAAGRPAKPSATTNVAFTYHGLRELGVPRDSLQSFPDEFAMGMKARRDILGDDGASAPSFWDPIWQNAEVHIFVWISGTTSEAVAQKYEEIVNLLDARSKAGVEQVRGHRGPEGGNDLPYQDASALLDADGQLTSREHFGYTDGISNPFFKGVSSHEATVRGGGKVTVHAPDTREGWEPLEAGEFLLGYKDEASECPEAPTPTLLARNGTFMVYRKLHQNVGSFDAYLDRVGKEFPGGKEALAAKFAGRWRNGAPVTTFPTEAEANQFAAQWQKAKADVLSAPEGALRDTAKARFAELNLRFTAFDYSSDLEGGRCPVGAHCRRANPRGALEFGQSGAFATPGAVSNRRRILRRGLPYGQSRASRVDQGDHGIIFMALNASIRRQFEFIQQQWMNYGNDFKLANDKDPLTGNHGTAGGAPDGRMIVGTEPNDPAPPFFCSQLPRFIETRGGDYFFVPSLTALRLIADGDIDPT
jgi:Dyp-type peroxidase family